MSELLAQILTEHAPEQPDDGDCLRVPEAVTAALRARGVEASTRVVMLHVGGAVMAMHQVTVADGVVLDGTARQYNPDLPGVWIEQPEVYLSELASGVGADGAAMESETTSLGDLLAQLGQ